MKDVHKRAWDIRYSLGACIAGMASYDDDAAPLATRVCQSLVCKMLLRQRDDAPVHRLCAPEKQA